jgi:antitoxin ParD1/3/4
MSKIALKPEQEKYILGKINQGVYSSLDELFAIAFQLLEEYELKQKENDHTQNEIEKIRQQVLEEHPSKTPQEKFALFLSQLPYVSDEEQADIEECFGLPRDYDRSEFIEVTGWVQNEASI